MLNELFIADTASKHPTVALHLEGAAVAHDGSKFGTEMGRDGGTLSIGDFSIISTPVWSWLASRKYTAAERRDLA
jgi:hypothetical protein